MQRALDQMTACDELNKNVLLSRLKPINMDSDHKKHYHDLIYKERILF